MAAQLLGDRRATAALAMLVWSLLVFLTIAWDRFQDQPVVVQDTYAAGTISPVTRAIKVTLLASGLLFVAWRFGVARMVLQRLNVYFKVFLLLVPASILWSISPDDTVKRFLTLLVTVSTCLAFCLASWHRARFQNVVRPCVTLILFASLIYGLLYPDKAIEHGTGTLLNSWRGLTLQKNEFGQLGSFGFIFWLHGWLARETPAWKAWPLGVMAMECVLLSRSSTSLLATLFSALLLLMLMRSPPALRRYMPYLIGLFAGTVLLYALTVLRLIPGLDVLLKPVTMFTGKDMTFSNRSVIWGIIKEHIQLHPLLGTGYGAYWTGPTPSSPSFEFIGRMYFYPSESHNGYLEIVNDLGFVGMFVLFGYLITFVRQSLQLLRFDRYQAALFLGLFFQQTIMNLSESTWLDDTSGVFMFVIMTLATFALARSLLQTQVEQAGPAPSRGRR